jgi:hypothetical protein
MFPIELVSVVKLAMPGAMFVEKLGNLYIKATVFGDFQEAFLAPPLDSIDADRCFADSESCLGDIVQSGLASRNLLYFHEEIQSGQLKWKIENRVPHQNLVVEIYDVESDDEVCSKQLLNQIVDSLLRIDPILGQIRAVGDSKRHSHVSFFFPTADVVGGTLSFQVEVDDIHPRRFCVLRLESCVLSSGVWLCGSWVATVTVR